MLPVGRIVWTNPPIFPASVNRSASLWGVVANDIFLGLFYPIGCGEPISQWLFLGFKGSIVVHSPESPHTHPDLNKLHQRIHYFGPVKENIKREGDLLLTYLQTVWWSEFQKDLSVSNLIYGKSQSKEHLNPFFMRHSSMGVF